MKMLLRSLSGEDEVCMSRSMQGPDLASETLMCLTAFHLAHPLAHIQDALTCTTSSDTILPGRTVKFLIETQLSHSMHTRLTRVFHPCPGACGRQVLQHLCNGECL